MTEEQKNLIDAKKVYVALCAMLDARQWHYQKQEEKLSITCGAQGEDLPMYISIEVDAKRQLGLLLSQMPFAVAENRRAALAVAVSNANRNIVDGSFDYDYLSGKIIFRMTSSYRGCIVSKEMLDYMLCCSCGTIDHYNDKFLAVAKNDMSFEQILEYIQ